MPSDPYRDLRERLEAIAEDLGDRALSCLREAVDAVPDDDGHGDDPGVDHEEEIPRRRAPKGRRRAPLHPAAVEERRLTRARRAVEKAAALLEPTGDDEEA